MPNQRPCLLHRTGLSGIAFSMHIYATRDRFVFVSLQDPVAGALVRLRSLADVHTFLFTQHKAYAVALEPRPKPSKEAMKTY